MQGYSKRCIDHSWKAWARAWDGGCWEGGGVIGPLSPRVFPDHNLAVSVLHFLILAYLIALHKVNTTCSLRRMHIDQVKTEGGATLRRNFHVVFLDQFFTGNKNI